MDKILEIVKLVIEQGPALIGHAVTAISAVIAICLVIPGQQPEKFLTGVVNFLAKFSKK